MKKSERLEARSEAAEALDERLDERFDERVDAELLEDRKLERRDKLLRMERALRIVDRSVLWSLGFGLVPVPFIDVVATGTIQVRMVDKLCHFYGVPFSRNRGKALIAGLIGGVVPTSLARGTFGGLLRLVPYFGTLLGVVTGSLLDGASTYAVGKVFIQQFESGGTFLDFNPDEWRTMFSKYYDEGKGRARVLAANEAAESA